MNFDKELVGLFVEFVTIKEEKPNMIHLPYFLDMFRTNIQKNFSLDEEFYFRLKNKVIKSIANSIFV